MRYLVSTDYANYNREEMPKLQIDYVRLIAKEEHTIEKKL